MAQLQLSLSRVVLRAIQGLDFARTHRWYCDQNACLFLARFLCPAVEVTSIHAKMWPRHASGCPMFLDADHREEFQPVTAAPRSLHFSSIPVRPLQRNHSEQLVIF